MEGEINRSRRAADSLANLIHTSPRMGESCNWRRSSTGPSRMNSTSGLRIESAITLPPLLPLLLPATFRIEDQIMIYRLSQIGISGWYATFFSVRAIFGIIVRSNHCRSELQQILFSFWVARRNPLAAEPGTCVAR